MAVRETGGGGFEALVSLLHFVSRGENFMERGATGQERPRRRRRRRNDGVMRMEGHPAAGDVLRRESDGW